MRLPISRKPEWLKVSLPGGENYTYLKSVLRKHALTTVCEEARCPNIGECWGGGTATFMLLGDVCTRGCRFCAVKSGKSGSMVDPAEPVKVANVIAEMGLNYIVITSVDRDDLPDGGAAHFARTVVEIKRRVPQILVETLIPDFQGDPEFLQTIVDSGADVIAHNVETVERLTPQVRDPRATYSQSLKVLQTIKVQDRSRVTKSSLMLGLGEEWAEIEQAMDDLRSVGVQLLTLGQYLRPSLKYLPVKRFLPPEEFNALQQLGLRKGFLYVAAGPLVRSSYRAGEYFIEQVLRGSEREANICTDV